MPNRSVVAKELAELFSVLSHADRIRIVEELRAGEVDVNGLQNALGISHSRVSQHLSVLRAHRLVSERREGRHVYYQLSQPKLAQWILGGTEFFGGTVGYGEEMRSAVEQVRALWGENN